MYRFELPDIGEGVVEAEILVWRVAEGDWVDEDAILVELLTDKAEIEIPSPRAGRVARLHFQVGDIAEVGNVLIEIDDEASRDTSAPQAEPVVASAEARAPEAAPTAPTGPSEPLPTPQRPRARKSATPARAPRPPAGGAPAEAVPAVRELAKRLGVDLREVQGTGPRGRIMRRDIEAFRDGGPAAGAPASRDEAPGATPRQPTEPTAAEPDDWRRQPLRGLRRVIAERMVESRRRAPHFTYVDEVDVTHLLATAEKCDCDDLSPLAFIANAVVRGLATHPILNASIDDARREIILKGKVHLGIATATAEGLIVPVIRDASELSVREMATRIGELAEATRTNRVAVEDLRGGTFTISSLGRLGGIASTPILNPPEVAILAVNAIRTEPRMVEGEVHARRVMNLSLSVDHRITDGLEAAQFIQDLRQILAEADFPELAVTEDEG